MRLALATLDSPALEVRIRTFEADLALLRRQQRAADDAKFLRAILLGTEGGAFTITDLRVRAAVDPDLRDALGAQRPRQLGQRLHRLTGRVLDGLCAARAKRDASGCIWQIQQA